MMRLMLLVLATLGSSPAFALAQPGDGRKDDPAEKFPALPKAFDTRRDDIAGGKLETVEYESTTVGVKRKAQVYTPPGYSKDPADAAKQLKLLWLSCGDKNGLIRISQAFHDSLEQKKVPHVWLVHPGGRHDFAVWKADLYHFAPLLFR